MGEVIPGKNLDGQGWHEVRSAERASRNNDDIIPCRPIELATFRGHLLRRRDRREHDEGAEGGEKVDTYTRSIVKRTHSAFPLTRRGLALRRAEERRGGKEGGSKCRSRRELYAEQKKKKTKTKKY